MNKHIPFFLSGYVKSKETSCTTVMNFSGKQSKKTCIFPFKYLGITYNSCTLNSAEEETESRILQAWCATKVDGSGKLVRKNSLSAGVCEPACQPRKLLEDINNEDSKKVGKDSSNVSIVIISITILILLTSILTIYCCYVKRNKREEKNDTIQDGNSYGNIEKNLTEIEGRSFPSAIVIKWSDIKIKSIIGEGNFGRIYQGDIHLNEIQK
jgi:hypothetical protein